jgi:hypothetical protein
MVVSRNNLRHERNKQKFDFKVMTLNDANSAERRV